MSSLRIFLRLMIVLPWVVGACAPSTATPAPPPAGLWEGWQYAGAYAIEVEPPVALVDAPVTIRVTGLQPDQPVTVRARLALPARTLESFATFIAGSNGEVDVSALQPLYGTYTTTEAMGLFWAMWPAADDDGSSALRPENPVGPLTVTLTAKANGRALATGAVQRLYYDEARVTREAVTAEGVVATLFTPTTSGPHPAVICLGGSGGDRGEGFAALLASHGYVALALAYFGVEPLPMELVEVPLEYFKQAIDWLKTQPAVDANRLAVLGGSKGAEAALLLAATYPEDLHAVVAYKPSAVVWMGLPRNPADNFQGPKSSWTLSGKPVPFLSGTFTFDLVKSIAGQPAALVSSYEAALDDAEAVAAAAIPVERITGPVLLISGGDDQLYPSTRMGEMIIERLNAHGVKTAHTHLSYPEAGHNLYVPYLPTTAANSGTVLLGGTPAADAAANAAAWPQVLRFLAEALQ